MESSIGFLGIILGLIGVVASLIQAFTSALRARSIEIRLQGDKRIRLEATGLNDADLKKIVSSLGTPEQTTPNGENGGGKE
jgi:hypothetical protein